MACIPDLPGLLGEDDSLPSSLSRLLRWVWGWGRSHPRAPPSVVLPWVVWTGQLHLSEALSTDRPVLHDLLFAPSMFKADRVTHTVFSET